MRTPTNDDVRFRTIISDDVITVAGGRFDVPDHRRDIELLRRLVRVCSDTHMRDPVIPVLVRRMFRNTDDPLPRHSSSYFRCLRYSLSEDTPACSRSVSSRMSLRTPSANSGPYSWRNVPTSVSPRLRRMLPSSSRHRLSRPSSHRLLTISSSFLRSTIRTTGTSIPILAAVPSASAHRLPDGSDIQERVNGLRHALPQEPAYSARGDGLP